MNETYLIQQVIKAIKGLYQHDILEKNVQISKTRKEFSGDYTLVVFPLLSISKKSPESTANDIGEYLKNNYSALESFNIVKGFLNLSLKSEFWIEKLKSFNSLSDNLSSTNNKVLIEFSSPNTNKPLHLGHIRNNLIGHSVSEILKKAGNEVVRVNLINDRGIHICKSMLAWQKWGNGETPTSSSLKGDHLIGKYYVLFDVELKKEIADLVSKGNSDEFAKSNTSLMKEAQEMLQKWERGDIEIINLWKKMNSWVYEGFEQTYNALGISFDKIYYESETYLLGKNIVAEGLKKGIVEKKTDNSIWVNLTDDGLDEKLLLRADGTSVYITQDLGTAIMRYNEYKPNKMIYVVGNEQNYHFQVLKLVLKKLGNEFSDSIQHLSYGMVELPDGKMKSREGTVVDADNLIDEMITTAKQISIELGKLDGFSDDEKNQIYKAIGLSALKYYILKVDPKKNMTFNPKESIDFNGNTGPFIQYTYVRINSILRKANDSNIEYNNVDNNYDLNEKELELIKLLNQYQLVINEAASSLSPAIIANYTYELAKEFNQFYHDFSILNAENETIVKFRLLLISFYRNVLKDAMRLLGIEMPERM